ncbi:restriction endonuclease subunit S [Empedobacter falsenii]
MHLFVELRFPEFKEKINFDLFKNHFDLISGYAFKSDYFNEDGIDLIIPKNFSKNGYGNFNENINKKTLENVDEKFTATKDDLLILLTDLTPSCELLGNPLYIKDDKLHYVNQRISKVVITNNLDKNYLKYILLTRRYKTHIIETATGTTVRHSSNKAVLNYKFFIPTLQEQTKIADFLGAVDKQLDILNQKKEKLNLYKKGVMQQLFSQQIRFKDDNGNDFPDWEEKTLGEVARINSGSSPTNILSKEGKIPYFKVEQLNNCKKYQINTEYFIDSSIKIITKGSIIFPKRGASILLNKVRILKVDGFMDTNMMSLTFNKDYNEFMYYLLVYKNLSKIADTTSIPQINNKHIEPYKITIPLIEEQTKIANFLSAIDNQIEAVENQITKTETYKKGLLQQMFV